MRLQYLLQRRHLKHVWSISLHELLQTNNCNRNSRKNAVVVRPLRTIPPHELLQANNCSTKQLLRRHPLRCPPLSKLPSFPIFNSFLLDRCRCEKDHHDALRLRGYWNPAWQRDLHSSPELRAMKCVKQTRRRHTVVRRGGGPNSWFLAFVFFGISRTSFHLPLFWSFSASLPGQTEELSGSISRDIAVLLVRYPISRVIF